MFLLDHLFSRLPTRRSPHGEPPSRPDRVRPFERSSLELADEYGAPEGSLPPGLVQALRAGPAGRFAVPVVRR